MIRVKFDVKVPAVRGQKLWFFPWAIRMEGGGRQEEAARLIEKYVFSSM